MKFLVWLPAGANPLDMYNDIELFQRLLFPRRELLEVLDNFKDDVSFKHPHMVHGAGNVASGVQGIGDVCPHFGFLLICPSTRVFRPKQGLVICVLTNQCTQLRVGENCAATLSITAKIVSLRSLITATSSEKPDVYAGSRGKSWGVAGHVKYRRPSDIAVVTG